MTADDSIYAFGVMRPGDPNRKSWAKVIETCKGKWKPLKGPPAHICCQYVFVFPLDDGDKGLAGCYHKFRF